MDNTIFQNIKSDETLPIINNYENMIYDDMTNKIIININIKNNEKKPIYIYINI